VTLAMVSDNLGPQRNNEIRRAGSSIFGETAGLPPDLLAGKRRNRTVEGPTKRVNGLDLQPARGFGDRACNQRRAIAQAEGFSKGQKTVLPDAQFRNSE